MAETKNPNDSAKPLVVVERHGAIVWLTLNRPEAANALSRALVATLGAELALLAGQSDLTAVVIAGAEGKAFCAGADLKERLAMTLDQTRTYLDELGALVQAIELRSGDFVVLGAVQKGRLHALDGGSATGARAS